jgi:hypothetical protein
MGVTTTADEKVRAARDHLEQAEKLLHEATDRDTWGFDEYSSEYQEKLIKLQMKLRKWLSKI